MRDIYYKVAHRPQEHIDSFPSRYEVFDPSIIPIVFKDALSLKVKNWKKSESWGTAHVIYYVSFLDNKPDLIFRANTGYGEPEVVMLTEKLITDKVLELGVATNKVLAVDVSRKEYSFDYQIEEVLMGKDVETFFKGTKEEYDKISFNLGQQVAKYSELEFNKFGLFDEQLSLQGKLVGTKDKFFNYISVCLESDLKEVILVGELRTSLIDEIIRLFEESEDLINDTKGNLVHHDLADHNIMFNPETNKIVGPFDWEAAVSGDPVLDLASCPTWKTFYPRKEILIDGFKSIKKLPDNFKERFDLYYLRTVIWKSYFAIRREKKLEEKRVALLEKALEPFRIKLMS